MAPGSGAAAGIDHAHAPRITATTATPLNTSSGPTTVAAPPSTGPRRTPTIAAPSAEPITPPRRSEGVAHTSQARPAAHEQAPPTPWAKRAASSRITCWAKPKITLVIPMSARPVRSMGFTPKRAAAHPAGIEARNVPAG